MKDLAYYKMNDLSECGVYVGTYGKYNDGSIEGMWIDLSKVEDINEFENVCGALHSDEKSPEYMIQDYQGFPRDLYNESFDADLMEVAIAYAKLDDDDKELLDDYLECFDLDLDEFTDIDDMLDKARDNYGKYDDFSDFAQYMADEAIETHSVKGATDFFERYFNYEQFERELDYEFRIGDNGYVFFTNC